MAASAVSKQQDVTQASVAREVYNVAMGGDATVAITPSKIKYITNVICTPTNAAASGTGAVYLSSFAVGNGSVTIAAPTTGTLLVTIEGNIA